MGIPEMSDRVYDLWERWQKVPGNSEWRELCYVIDDGKFNIDLTYPGQIPEPDDDDEYVDRRGLVVAQYFGDMKIDYSRPD